MNGKQLLNACYHFPLPTASSGERTKVTGDSVRRQVEGLTGSGSELRTGLETLLRVSHCHRLAGVEVKRCRQYGAEADNFQVAGCHVSENPLWNAGVMEVGTSSALVRAGFAIS